MKTVLRAWILLWIVQSALVFAGELKAPAARLPNDFTPFAKLTGMKTADFWKLPLHQLRDAGIESSIIGHFKTNPWHSDIPGEEKLNRLKFKEAREDPKREAVYYLFWIEGISDVEICYARDAKSGQWQGRATVSMF